MLLSLLLKRFYFCKVYCTKKGKLVLLSYKNNLKTSSCWFWNTHSHKEKLMFVFLCAFPFHIWRPKRKKQHPWSYLLTRIRGISSGLASDNYWMDIKGLKELPTLRITPFSHLAQWVGGEDWKIVKMFLFGPVAAFLPLIILTFKFFFVFFFTFIFSIQMSMFLLVLF